MGRRRGVTLVEMLVVVGMIALVLTTLLRFNSQTLVLRAHERRAMRAVAEVFPLASFKALNMGTQVQVVAWRRGASEPWKVGLRYGASGDPDLLVGLPSSCNRVNGIAFSSGGVNLASFDRNGKLVSSSPATIECRFVAYTINVDAWGNARLARTR